MIDIHCHILQGIDDGSSSIEESVKMAMFAESGGTKIVVATPHSNVPNSFQNLWDSSLLKKIKEINKILSENQCTVRIFPGQEIFCSGRFLSLLKAGKLITLNDSKYPLVEFDFFEHSSNVYSRLEQLLAEGFVPIVAHPERYAFVCEDSSAAMRLKNMGCLLQINKGSLNGGFGRDSYVEAHRLIEEQLADFVASDGHSPYMRTPFLGDIHEMISDLYSESYADILLKINPKLVLQNKEIVTF